MKSMKKTDLIVLVEDSHIDAVIMQKCVDSASGIKNRFLHFKSAEEAIEYFNGRGDFAGKEPEVPALMILDIMLPQQSGIAVLRDLRGIPELGSVPVLVVSGSREFEHVSDAHALGINGYIIKPFSSLGMKEALQCADSKLIN